MVCAKRARADRVHARPVAAAPPPWLLEANRQVALRQCQDRHKMDADFLMMAAQDLGRLSRNSAAAPLSRRSSIEGGPDSQQLGASLTGGGSPFGAAAAAVQRSKALDCPKRPQDARRWDEQASAVGSPQAPGGAWSGSQQGPTSFSVSWAMRFERSFKRHMSQ